MILLISVLTEISPYYIVNPVISLIYLTDLMMRERGSYEVYRRDESQGEKSFIQV